MVEQMRATQQEQSSQSKFKKILPKTPIQYALASLLSYVPLVGSLAYSLFYRDVQNLFGSQLSTREAAVSDSKNTDQDSALHNKNLKQIKLEFALSQAKKLQRGHLAELVGGIVGLSGMTALVSFMMLDFKNPELLNAAKQLGMTHPKTLVSATDYLVFIVLVVSVVAACAKAFGAFERAVVEGSGLRGVVGTLVGGFGGDKIFLKRAGRDPNSSEPGSSIFSSHSQESVSSDSGILTSQSVTA